MLWFSAAPKDNTSRQLLDLTQLWYRMGCGSYCRTAFSESLSFQTSRDTYRRADSWHEKSPHGHAWCQFGWLPEEHASCATEDKATVRREQEGSLRRGVTSLFTVFSKTWRQMGSAGISFFVGREWVLYSTGKAGHGLSREGRWSLEEQSGTCPSKEGAQIQAGRGKKGFLGRTEMNKTNVKKKKVWNNLSLAAKLNCPHFSLPGWFRHLELVQLCTSHRLQTNARVRTQAHWHRNGQNRAWKEHAVFHLWRTIEHLSQLFKQIYF